MFNINSSPVVENVCRS